MYSFKVDFINIKLLYAKLTVQITVNSVLTDKFEIHRGVKQGCPLSAAINLLIRNIKADTSLCPEAKVENVLFPWPTLTTLRS